MSIPEDGGFDPERGFSDVLGKNSLKEICSTTINSSSLLRAIDGLADAKPIKVKNNKDFWAKIMIGDIVYPERVILEGFLISEWLPSSPGRYFTPDAATARNTADDYLVHSRKEFLPMGKSWMVLGGVGTIRLAPRDLRRREVVWLGATSDGVCHRGVPLICPMEIAEQLQPKIHRNGGLLANITGSIWSISDRDLPIKFPSKVPRVLVFCEDIKVLGRAKKNSMRATASVMFDVSSQPERHYGQRSDSSLSKGWTFASFDPVGGSDSLDNAVCFIKEYIRRYGSPAGGRNTPAIFSDFDETIEHFADEVEFPLCEIMQRQIDMSLFRGYIRELKLTVQGDFLVSNSTKYEVSGGQVGAFGEGASARDVTQQMVVGGPSQDLSGLVTDLSVLRTHLATQAKNAEDFVQIGAIAEAEQAAKAGDYAGALKALSKAGDWALAAATTIGTAVAAAAIKTGLGI